MQRRKKLQNSSEKNGFTLAEVLITLVIIGVIGALTVPALIQNTHKQEYVSALKKAYSTLSQVTQQIISEEGSPLDGWGESDDAVYKEYKKRLNILKDCGGEEGCMPQLGTGSQGYKALNGSSYSSNYNTNKDWRRFVLADGAQIMINQTNKTCSPYCANVWADINGAKGPNQYGRDMFLFHLKENGLFPPCSYYNDCTNDGTGHDCSCRVLTEGAMNY